MRRVAWLLVMTACNRAFDIVPTEPQPDAPPPLDSDADGTIDLNDNCPLLANDQSDEDHDLVGDRCDNCPLVSNPSQDLEGDADAVGTACDPHPETDGDCLVLFDSFTDPDRFAATWSSYGTTPPAFETRPGSVTVTPTDTNLVALVARDDLGVLLSGMFDTQLAATLPLSEGSALYASSNIPAGTTYGYGCGLYWPTGARRSVASRDSSLQDGTTIVTPALFGEAVTTAAVMRLTVASPAVPAIGCRTEYGTAVGSSRFDPVKIRTDGAPGVVVSREAATLDAIAFYRVQSAPCETAYR